MELQQTRNSMDAALPVLPEAYVAQRWYAAYTCARHEKRVAEQLKQRDVESLLPLYQTVRRWKNGKARVQVPLFPGYVFVRIALKDRLQVLNVPSVVRLVGFDGHPVPLADEEVEAIRTCLNRGTSLSPHPYLTTGRRVRVVRGPLEGIEGKVVRQKNQTRFVISLDLIQRAVATEIDQDDLLALR